MLCIRTTQLHALRAPAQEKYIADVLALLEAHHPRVIAALGRDVAAQRARHAVDCAARWRIADAASIGMLVELTVRFGQDFETSARDWIAAEVARDPAAAMATHLPAMFQLAAHDDDMAPARSTEMYGAP